MRLFGSERYMGMIEKMGFADDTPLEAKMLSGAIETAQKRVEGMNFDRRENVLKYDDVMNTQRELIYKERRQVLDGTDITDTIRGMISSYVEDLVARHTQGGEFVDDWDLEGLIKEAEGAFLPEGEISYTFEDKQNLEKLDLIEQFTDNAFEHYAKKEEEFGFDAIRELERIIMLRVVDTRWMDHIDEMDQLKQGIWLRSYGQKDPAMEYKAVGSDMFDEMIANIKVDVGRFVLTAKINTKRAEVAKAVSESREENPGEKKRIVTQAKSEKVGRNDPCPCGSGLKYKKCCGK